MYKEKNGVLYYLEKLGMFWGSLIALIFFPFILVIVFIEVLFGFDNV